MVKVLVKFYSHLGDLVDRKEKIEFDLTDGATISHLLDELILDSKIKMHILDKAGELKSDITFLKNGREIKFLNGLDTILDSDDEISIFPLVAGG